MIADSDAPTLFSSHVRLRGDGSAEVLRADDTFWERLGAGDLGSFRGEYLVSCHAFDSGWPIWEMHPNGDEIVCLISGQVTFVLENGAGSEEVVLKDAGAFLVVPRGTWHTARTSTPTRLLFITAGEATQHRDAGAPR